jgi:hypothetical protein
MYWKIDEYIDDHDNTWLIYNYFEVIKFEPQFRPYYNGILKEMKYPQEQELVIKAALAGSEEEFDAWYNENKRL